MSITMNTFIVSYYISYMTSDMLAACRWTGTDEDDCLKSFQSKHPFPVKSVVLEYEE